ncbi:MAG: cytochrome b N-terminal domain-containing protein [Deltaproteobacteria bacterium]
MQRALDALENLIDETLSPRYNPLYCLGAICVFFLWVLLVSGVYLFVFYKIGSPYESVKTITENQWMIGAFFRGMHRYSADGLVFFALLHLSREFIRGRFRHGRWTQWVTGVLTLGVIWTTGVIGYWMVWDQRSQLVAELSSKLLDYLPIFGESLSIAFTTPELVTNLFFLIALFLHLTLPVLLFIFIWLHVMRVTKPRIHPPRPVYAGVAVSLAFMAVFAPVKSLLPANTDKIISVIGIDWFYLFIYPMLNSAPAWLSWLTISASTAVLIAVPWIFPKKRPAPAAIKTENCSGCAVCREECPYSAIFIRPSGPDAGTAEVIPSRCASCGICVGSCAFNAVDFPIKRHEDIMAEISAKVLGAGNKGPFKLFFACSHISGLDHAFAGHAGPDMRQAGLIKLPCAGMVNAGWIEYALKLGAGNVVILGCKEGAGWYRTGNTLLSERVAMLSDKDNASRVSVHLTSRLTEKTLHERISAVNEGVRLTGDV